MSERIRRTPSLYERFLDGQKESLSAKVLVKILADKELYIGGIIDEMFLYSQDKAREIRIVVAPRRPVKTLEALNIYLQETYNKIDLQGISAEAVWFGNKKNFLKFAKINYASENGQEVEVYLLPDVFSAKSAVYDEQERILRPHKQRQAYSRLLLMPKEIVKDNYQVSRLLGWWLVKPGKEVLIEANY